MSEQLQPGDLAIIIESVEGGSNGKIVQCVKTDGEHSLYGLMWVVTSKETLVTEHGGVGNRAHVPQKWLRKIKPGETDLNRDMKILVKELDSINKALEKLL